MVNQSKYTWSKTEVAILVYGYYLMDHNILSREYLIKEISNRLRYVKIKNGINIDDTYRNENGISMKLGNVQYLFTKKKSGFKHTSLLEQEVYNLFQNDRKKFIELLEEAKKEFNIFRDQVYDDRYVEFESESDDWYEMVNKPRIKTVSEWEDILVNELEYAKKGGFDFVNRVLVNIYRRPNHLVFCRTFEQEENLKAINARVGEFRDRVHRYVQFPELRRIDKPEVDRAWNIPFTTSKEENNRPEHKGKFSWVLREELVEAMENIMPSIKEYKGESKYSPLEFSEFPLLDKPIVEYSALEFMGKIELSDSASKINQQVIFRPKRDYIKENKNKKKIGDFGEQKVVEEEKKKLLKLGLKDLANKVEIVKSDSYGYDVISFDESGREKHIEVKTSKNSKNSINFYISAYELEIMQSDPVYELHYLCNLNGREIQYVCFSHDDLITLLQDSLVPIQYQVNISVLES